jgi:hypothetical protein
MTTTTKLSPCISDDINYQTLKSSYELPSDLSLNSRLSVKATNPEDNYDTYFNGLRVDDTTYGIYGTMIYNRHDVQVFGQDNIFVTSEPKNNAPLESLVIYSSNNIPYFTVYDWGAASKGYHFISFLDDDFVNKYHHVVTTPDNDSVCAFIFQNSFNFDTNCNQVLLYNNSGQWDCIYQSATTGLPSQATNPSGWSVFEFKKQKYNNSPLPNVPFMLGVFGIQVMDQNGNWSVPNGRAVTEHSGYVSVFSNNDGWAYKNA